MGQSELTIISILFKKKKLFWGLEKEKGSHLTFCKTRKILTPKADVDTLSRQKYRPVSFTNPSCQVLNKIPEN